MGRKLDALLGRNFRVSKFRPLLTLAFSRLAILKNQRHVRSSQARSDVLQLLHLGHHQRALIRVEQVIKEQNALDAYVMIEGYLNLLIERVNLLEQDRECPEELREAIAGLIFAASRCGDFPELQEIKSVLTTRLGKEFTARVVELRNNCGVSHLLMQKLSTKQPSLESRMNVLKTIASESDIVLQLDEAPLPNEEGKLRQNKPIVKEDDSSSSSIQARQKYKHVADAAQAAFESAAQAAAAARAAVELSRFESDDPDDSSSPHGRQEQRRPEVESKPKQEIDVQTQIQEDKAGDTTAELKNSTPVSPSRDLSEEENSKIQKQRASNLQTGLETEPEHETPITAEIPQKLSFPLQPEKKPMSVRTRRLRGY